MRNTSNCTLNIDRHFPFSPQLYPFIDGDLAVADEDVQSLRLTTLDLNKVELVSMQDAGLRSPAINGTERIRRLRQCGYVCLDALFWQNLFFERQHLIPESWKKRVNDHHAYIHFDGTQICDKRDPTTLYGFWISWYACSGKVPSWKCGMRWLGEPPKNLYNLSAVLAPPGIVTSKRMS